MAIEREPEVEEAVSTAAANRGLKPAFFIIGIVMDPMDTVLATALPDVVPINPEAKTATIPGTPQRFYG